MCDSCGCSAFAPHLWKVGECRDCHHPLASHTSVLASTPPDKTTLENNAEIARVKRLTSDRLQPFASPLMASTPLSISPSVRTLQRSNTTVGHLSVNKDLFVGVGLLKHAASSKDLKSMKTLDDVTVTETDEVQRNKIIGELVSTERDYCRDLDFIVDHIMMPLMTRGVLDKNSITRIFSNIQEIRNVNAALLQYLEQHGTNLSALGVCEIFSKMAPFFKCYSQYCNLHTQSLEVIQARKADCPPFSAFLKSLNPLLYGLRIEDFLIKPIQRICKYPLFFNSLVQATGSNSTDLPILKEATKKMHDVAQHVNEFRRIAENMRRVLVHSSRRFLFEIIALVLAPDREWATRTLYLFNDMLMYARPPSKFNKKSVYVGHIMLDEVRITDEDQILRLVRHGGEEYLLIQCHTPEDRIKLMNLAQTAIGESTKVKERIEGATINGRSSRTNTPSPPLAHAAFDEDRDSPQAMGRVTSVILQQQNSFRIGQIDIASKRASLRPTQSKFSFASLATEIEEANGHATQYPHQTTPLPQPTILPQAIPPIQQLPPPYLEKSYTYTYSNLDTGYASTRPAV